ncbi:MAG: DUF6263 family protein [Ferruginibacter sp.]
MKNMLAILLALTVNFGVAQKNQISLSAKERITSSNQAVIETEMNVGMPMTIKNDMHSVYQIDVLEEKGEFYKIGYTLKKMKVSVESPQGNMSYDSDNPADADSEIGKSMGDRMKVNETKEYILNRLTGEVKPVNPDTKTNENANMAKVMGGGQTIDPIEQTFIVLPTTQLNGTWNSESTEDGLTMTKTYTIQSVENNRYSVLLKTKISGNTNTEVQGMAASVTMNSETTSLLTITSNGVILKREDTTVGDAAMDMMGQSIPMNIKSTISVDNNLR